VLQTLNKSISDLSRDIRELRMTKSSNDDEICVPDGFGGHIDNLMRENRISDEIGRGYDRS
jgi:hypothetical protein